MTDRTLTLVFGDDPSDKLHPLTQERLKSALPFGGEYRVIDFVLTNCLHSGLRRILVLSGGRAHSLYGHLRDGWSVFNPALGEYITPFPTPGGLRRNHSESLPALHACVHQIRRSGAIDVVVLVGSHIYRMDYAAMIRSHREHDSDVTVGYVSGRMSARSNRPRLDVEGGRIRNIISRASRSSSPDPDNRSEEARLMGAYVFKAQVLIDALAEVEEVEDGSAGRDFAEGFIRPLTEKCDVRAYQFGGRPGRVSRDRFWAELDSLDSYFEANMALLEPVPPIDLYQTDWPVWSHSGPNPPARTVESASGNEGLFVNSVVSNGTIVAGGAVSRSVLCRRVRVNDSAVVERAVLFDDVVVGEGAEIRNCIVDKGARIEPGARIGYDAAADAARFTVTPAGVVVVGRDENVQ